MKLFLSSLVFAVTFFILGFTATANAEQLRISVAASMTDVLKELISNFSTHHKDIQILPNFGPSGGLAKQINLGAPADIYISANPKWMDYLIEQRKIDISTRKTFAHNSLVFVGTKNEDVTSLADLPQLQRIGIASPKSVPAGQYAEQALCKTGLYKQLLGAGKLVMAKDVRQALIYADRGETDGSFVYTTDALLAKQAVILFNVPQDLYSHVTYPLALTQVGATKPAAQSFYDYITSEDSHDIINKYGFSLPQ